LPFVLQAQDELLDFQIGSRAVAREEIVWVLEGDPGDIKSRNAHRELESVDILSQWVCD
jgi:hypothetical protein